MYKKNVYVLLIAVLIIALAEGKRSRRIRRPTNEDDNTTPQPSVVTYSTFGFNDVGSYDGFIPTSPDYASYLSDNQESTTRLYAPAFPSAADQSGFNNNFEDGASFGNGDDNEPQSSMIQYPQSSVNFFNTPSFDGMHSNQNKNSYEVNEPSEDEPNLVYGTKLGTKSKKQSNQLNNSEFNVYSSGPLANTNDLASRFVMPGMQPTFDTKNNNYELDNKYQVATYSAMINNQNENMFTKNNGEQINKYIQPTPTMKDMTSFNTKHLEENSEKDFPKQSSYLPQDFRQNYISPTPMKSNHKVANYNSEYKDNYKNRQPGNYNNNDAKVSINPSKGYEYSTNFSSTSFTYDFDSEKKPYNVEDIAPVRKPINSNTDELVPASSNIVDFPSYNFPENDYSNFKKVPNVKIPYEDDFDTEFGKDKYKNDEYINQFKNLYTTTTPTSQWGSYFKSPDISYKHRVKKPQFEENSNSDIVHIPKRPLNSYNKYNYGKNQESKPNDYPKQRPYKSNKYEKSKDAYNRFKSEEDLLGLRNHDSSHSYTPPHRPSGNDLSDEHDYKKLIEKWRQSYLKSKYKDSYRDYESYASEAKPLHVPIPKPYPIEVPQPVIVPIPQPYPVRVPMPKPVAVPVIREITVPVEKPVPYPVIKNVPYPVEKPVPVVVHKEVQVPVVKPYPVHIPHVRPVFHHSRPPREDFDSEVYSDEDDYRPRPDTSKRIPPYKKRPGTTRGRPRRPSRTTYERNTRERRRGPQSHRLTDRSRRPPAEVRYSRHKYQDYDSDPYDNEPITGDLYYLHCKRTGTC